MLKRKKMFHLIILIEILNSPIEVDNHRELKHNYEDIEKISITSIDGKAFEETYFSLEEFMRNHNVSDFLLETVDILKNEYKVSRVKNTFVQVFKLTDNYEENVKLINAMQLSILKPLVDQFSFDINKQCSQLLMKETTVFQNNEFWALRGEFYYI
jgi:hypothetical protein